METKTISYVSDLPENERQELRLALTQDILERYDHQDYHDPAITSDFLRDKGYILNPF